MVDAKRSLKVLLYSPSIGYSHLQFHGRLADLLVDAGHEVHIFIPDWTPVLAPYTGSSKAHKVVRLRTPRAAAISSTFKFVEHPFTGHNNLLFEGSTKKFGEILYTQCEDILAADDTLAFLKDQRYAIGIAEAWQYHPFSLFCALGIRTYFGTDTQQLSADLAGFLGIPSPASTIPHLTAAVVSGDRMSYRERARNLYIRLLAMKGQGEFVDAIDKLYRQKFGETFPSVHRLRANMSFAFINANEFLALPRPISNKIVYVGGVVKEEPKPLSKEVQAVFDQAEEGVVLFSFGSIADASKMPLEMKLSFMKAFAKFPAYQFIWKFQMTDEDSQLFEAYPNVHTFEWVDQVSILAHPKTRAFITHCGQNSLNEAGYNGVPMIAIPLFADQLYNAAIVKKKEIGVYVDIRKVTAHSVHCALDQVLNDER
ncbi:CRE-UGT-49 protein [Aphelenchoides avenae]|nr:CRE-UGT-49 protein [Aphelenchus avenae]